jgi:hypothetical protein
MNRLTRQVLEVAAMVAISAFLYVEFFRLNGLVFSQFEHIEGVNWIFLPAGFRVLLVLGMGLPGAAGILLGNCWLDKSSFSEDTVWLLLATGVASGFTPWCVKCVMEKKRLLTKQLEKLSAHSLLQFVLAYAAANAVAHQFVWWALKRPGNNPLVDIWPMFVGDAIGALLILYILKLMLPALSAWAARFRTKPQAKTGPAGR